MGDRVRLSRGKPHLTGRGTKKPRAHNPGPRRASAAEFEVFGERHRREFDSSPWPMRIFEHGTFRFLAVNDAAAKLYGYTREEFLTLTAKDTRHPEEHADFLTTLDEPTGYFRHRGPRRHIKKNGEIIVVEAVTQDILFNGRKARLSMNIDVTERTRMMELLRKREQEFEALVENAPDIIMRFDRHLRHVYVNRAGSAATGIGSRGFIGKTSRELGMTPDLVRPWEQSLGEVFESKREKTIEFGCRKPEGLRHYESRIVPETGLDGRVETALVISRDITARKRAEVALRESSEFLQRMIESSRDCIKVLDLEGRLLWISVGGQRLMEIDEVSSLLGKSYLDFWSGSDRDAAHNALVAALAGGVSRFEAYCPTTKGVPKWWDELVTPMLGNDGRPEKLLVVSRDITEHKRAEIALRESEERFRQLAENIREVFWINTPAGDHIDYISPGYEEIWGRSRESLYLNPRSWMEPIHPGDLPAVQNGQEKMARGQRTDVDYRIIRPDGTLRWIRDRSYPMKRGDGTRLVCGIAEDITESKQAEARRIADVVRQRDALVREVHHRIKNNLQGVVGLLRQLAVDDSLARPVIDKAISQLQAIAVVHGLEARRVRRMIGLRDILLAIGTAVQGMTPAEFELDLGAAEDARVQLAETEAVAVALVLNELLLNAARSSESMPKSGRVSVMLRTEAESIRVTISNPGRLPPQFDFAHARGLGTGLELVRSLLPQNGARLTFSEAAGRVNAELEISAPVLVTQRSPALAAQH